MCSSMPAAMSSQFVPCIIIGIPHAVSTFSTARRISALLSVSVLPHSLVIESASSSRCCSSSVFSRNNGCTRSTTGVRRQSINARCATSTAAFTSAAGESGTSASTVADAGLITFKVSVALDPRQSPSMKFCKRSISTSPQIKCRSRLRASSYFARASRTLSISETSATSTSHHES